MADKYWYPERERRNLNSRTRISTVSKDAIRTITQVQGNLNDHKVAIENMNSGFWINGKELKELCSELQEGMEELWRLLK